MMIVVRLLNEDPFDLDLENRQYGTGHCDVKLLPSQLHVIKPVTCYQASYMLPSQLHVTKP